MCKRYVVYLRVSTDQQGRSGLGIEAQQAAITAFIAGKEADAKLLASYSEVKTGKHSDRPQLVEAMNHSRLTGSTLLIAKLDRLSRDAHFLLGLQKASVPFVACDMPDANNLTVGIMALVAQQEREAISQRTKAVLAAAKARGTKLGNPNGARCLRAYAAAHGNHASKATAALKAGAQQRATDLQATIARVRARGITSARASPRP